MCRAQHQHRGTEKSLMCRISALVRWRSGTAVVTFIFFVATSPLIFLFVVLSAVLMLLTHFWHSFLFLFFSLSQAPGTRERSREALDWNPTSLRVQSDTNRSLEETSAFSTYEQFHLLNPSLGDFQILCSPGPSPRCNRQQQKKTPGA